jgi:hypothetical protein
VTAGAGFNGAGGTTNSASLDSSRAITLGKDFGRVAESACVLAGAVPVTVPVAAVGLVGLAFSLGALRVATTGAVPVATLAVLRDDFALAALVAAFGRGLAFALGVLRGTLAGADCAGLRAGDLNVTTAGPPAKDRSDNTCANGMSGDVEADFGSVTFSGASTTRRSGTSIRRSCQGKAKPGSPNS